MSVIEGSLSKWTNMVKGWQYRWFVLDEISGLLSYYTSREKMALGLRRGYIRLKNAVIGIDKEDDSTFTITVESKTFHFQAKDAKDREKWIRALEDTITRQKNQVKIVPSLKDCDQRISESDAYLILMIKQKEVLEHKIDTLENKDQIEHYRHVINQANVVLEHIKHSIVLLQIAKNTAHPVYGIYQGPISSNSSNQCDTSDLASLSLVETGEDVMLNNVESEIFENQKLNPPITLRSNISNLNVPDTSYSSSDEGDFYDADDDFHSVTSSQGSHDTNPKLIHSSSIKKDSIEEDNSDEKLQTEQNTTVPQTNNEPKQTVDKYRNSNGNLDFDALYENNDDDENNMIDSHGYVISHLISQIKIGMDLTKVVLPTFILERRSLLEMYADYFAHPDIFLKVAELDDPKDRMMQVVKWYLSSYHAGRKISVAKKPYNPILGEIFKCYWDVPSNYHSNKMEDYNSELVSNGPIEWATKDQLTFVAEQVSHHPPTFYAEHYKRKVSFNAHIYTKSKFLGLSVCVYNIGQGVLTLHEKNNEQYIVTFPNGYGRSILTVPWIELGGEVKISCPSNGYHANIDFITKPFYSNKKHRVNCDVYGPENEQTPICKISGEWNGVMEIKWANKTHSEIFIDVNKLAIIKKHVQPIDQQQENESRRLWKEVTAGLKFNNIEQATSAKFQLEQKQRLEAKQRLENNETWMPRLFEYISQDWVYKYPLDKRLKDRNEEKG